MNMDLAEVGVVVGAAALDPDLVAVGDGAVARIEEKVFRY
jgi:hypothetical protein